jgi:hypothetical protein
MRLAGELLSRVFAGQGMWCELLILAAHDGEGRFCAVLMLTFLMHCQVRQR